MEFYPQAKRHDKFYGFKMVENILREISRILILVICMYAKCTLVYQFYSVLSVIADDDKQKTGRQSGKASQIETGREQANHRCNPKE